MKRVIETEELSPFESLLGETVQLWCLNYFYTGRLTGINGSCVELSDAAVVYDTGPLDSDFWSNSQKSPEKIYVKEGAIESFSKVSKS